MPFLDPEGNIMWYTVPAGLLALDTIVAAVRTIMGFKDRKKQMRQCKALMVRSILIIVIFAVVLILENGTFSIDIIPPYPVLAFVNAVFAWLAYKGVKADDDLVRSADRIR